MYFIMPSFEQRQDRKSKIISLTVWVMHLENPLEDRLLCDCAGEIRSDCDAFLNKTTAPSSEPRGYSQQTALPIFSRKLICE